MLPFVSVVVPVLNRKDLLENLIHSMRSLTYPRDRFEVIVVDNGSTDGAWEWVREVSSQVNFCLRCLRNESAERVPSASRNLGTQSARGEIVAFTDSDCVVTPNWIDEGVACFRPETGIVQGKTLPNPDQPRPPLYRSVTVLAKGYGETCNIFYRREAILRVGGFHRDFFMHSWGEDTHLAYLVRDAGYAWQFCESSLVYHHVHPHTLLSWLAEPLRAFTWNKTVRHHPAIRTELLYHRYFLSRTTALFDLMLLGIATGWLLNPWCLGLAVPFLVRKYREGGDHLGTAGRLARVAAGSARAAIIFAVLLSSSVRFRSLVI